MNAYRAQIEWDEDGARLVLSTDEGTQTFKLDDPEQFYDAVKGGIGPWLYEREQAFQEFRQQAHVFSCRVDESAGLAEAWRDAADLQRKREKEGAA